MTMNRHPLLSRPARTGFLLLAVAALVVVGLSRGAAPGAGVPVIRVAADDGWTHPLVELREANPELRVHGEFGLSVHLDRDSVTVRWLTAQAEEGFLEVVAGGQVTDAFQTQAWASHRVRFDVPPAAAFLVRYGSAVDPGDRHETWVRLEGHDRPAPVRVRGVDTLWVMADIHGEHDRFVEVLHSAGLVDAQRRWSGGTAHLVVAGDVMSRGMDVAAVLWLLHRLEAEAAEAGGAVHLLLGNHEIMVMLQDLRYVHPKETWIAESHDLSYDRLYDTRRSYLGRWLASRPAILMVDDVLLAHAGVADRWLDWSPESHADSLRAFMAEDLFHFWADLSYVPDLDEEAFNRRHDFFWDSASVFWYRGYSQSDTQGEELEAVLEQWGAGLHVVGHTPVPGIREVLGGRLILTNTLPFADEALRLSRDPGASGGWARARIGREGPMRPLLQGYPEP